MAKEKVQTLTSLLVSFICSLLITGFARPSDVPFLGLFAATFGYAIFWHTLSQQKLSKKAQWTWLWLLYCCSSLIQTRWLLSHPFCYIIGVWLFLGGFLSLPYAFITQWWLKQNRSVLVLASAFALFDMIEPHLFFCGISFRSIGTFLMASTTTSQLITLLGGEGLVFLVILMNALVYKALQKRTPFWSLLFFLFVPATGFLLQHSLPTTSTHTPMKVAIMHWNSKALLTPSFYDLYESYRQNILRLTKALPLLQKEAPNLIVLPEGALPYSLETRLLARQELPSLLQQHIQENSAFIRTKDIFQALAIETKSDILVGLERNENGHYFNSCFLFVPDGSMTFYDKRVLVPGGEYIPLEEVFKPILQNYGITSSFCKGKEAKTLQNKSLKLFPLICYEETLSQYVRPAKKIEPDLLVSLSNDHWFPTPFFARDHWLLGKMRAMEFGIPLIRCTNMGQSGVILADGKEIKTSQAPTKEEIMIVTFDPEQRTTLYSFLSDPILALLFLTLFFTFWKVHLIPPK